MKRKKKIYIYIFNYENVVFRKGNTFVMKSCLHSFTSLRWQIIRSLHISVRFSYLMLFTFKFAVTPFLWIKTRPLSMARLIFDRWVMGLSWVRLILQKVQSVLNRPTTVRWSRYGYSTIDGVVVGNDWKVITENPRRIQRASIFLLQETKQRKQDFVYFYSKGNPYFYVPFPSWRKQLWPCLTHNS